MPEVDNVSYLRDRNKTCPVCGSEMPKEKFYCGNKDCSAWLPHLNTSWIRSTTNLLLIKRILEVIENNNVATKDALCDTLVRLKIITLDPTRTDRNYFTGGPLRRAAEYIQIFKYLGILSEEKKTFSLTSFGRLLSGIEKRGEFVSAFVLMLTHFNPSNHYTTKTYDELKLNYFLLILDFATFLKKENIEFDWRIAGLCYTCRNKVDYKNLKVIAKRYSPEEVKEIFWRDSKEYRRVVTGCFKMWLKQTNLIDEKGVTPFGNSIYELYKDYVFIENSEIMNSFYSDSEEYNVTEMKKISNLLDTSTEPVNKFKFTLNIKKKEFAKTGSGWEQYVFNHLQNLELNPKWYKDTRNFAEIRLPNSILNSLPGGSKHNPDIIIEDPVLLIDPKKDVNIEMHKVAAYDKYANLPEVNAHALICTKEVMRKELSKRVSDYSRTSVIDKDALDLLVNNKNNLTSEQIFKIIGVNNESVYINEVVLLDRIDALIH